MLQLKLYYHSLKHYLQHYICNILKDIPRNSIVLNLYANTIVHKVSTNHILCFTMKLEN